jgi:hypothetical protein
MSFDELQIGRVRLLFVRGEDSKEKFASSRYDAVRHSLVRDIAAKTADARTFRPRGSEPDFGPQ